MRDIKTFSLSLPSKLLQETEQIARKEGKTKSEVLREALRRYIQEKKWQELKDYGARQVQRLGIEESDVERIIDEYRKKRD